MGQVVERVQISVKRTVDAYGTPHRAEEMVDPTKTCSSGYNTKSQQIHIAQAGDIMRDEATPCVAEQSARIYGSTLR